VTPVALDIEDWCYVSGRCAALEGKLLGEDFFLDLLEADSAQEAYGRVSKTGYVSIFPHAESLTGYDRAIGARFEEILRDIGDSSPANGPTDIFNREMELKVVHELLVRQEIAKAGPEETERWAGRLERGYGWLGGFFVPQGARGMFEIQPVRCLSLWADAAYLIEMAKLASACPELDRYISALVSLSCVEVCWRAMKSGIEIEMLTAFFFRPPLPSPPEGELRAIAMNPSPSAVMRLLGPPDFSVSDSEFDQSFGVLADDYLTVLAAIGRHEVFGPRRVLHYLRRAWVEQFDMRLCLAAVLTPIDRREARRRLRHG